MIRSALLLTVVCASVAVPASASQAVESSESIVLAQDLPGVRSVGVTALWTRRKESYTLQLVIPAATLNRNTGVRIAARASAATPKVEIWLLGANGSQIRPVMRKGPYPEVCVNRCQAQELLFRFSLPDGAQAIAAAIQVGDQFFVEKLKALESVERP